MPVSVLVDVAQRLRADLTFFSVQQQIDIETYYRSSLEVTEPLEEEVGASLTWLMFDEIDESVVEA